MPAFELRFPTLYTFPPLYTQKPAARRVFVFVGDFLKNDAPAAWCLLTQMMFCVAKWCALRHMGNGCADAPAGSRRSQVLLLSTTPSRWKRNPETPAGVSGFQIKNNFPLNMARVQQRRPLPVAETGRNCWGSGLQDASAAPRHEADAGCRNP